MTVQLSGSPRGTSDAVRLESLCAQAWPAVVDRPLGEWRLRAAAGFTSRANSTLAVGDPGMPVAMALDEVSAFSLEQGIAPRVAMVVSSAEERRVEEAGWRWSGHPAAEPAVSVLTGRVCDLRTRLDATRSTDPSTRHRVHAAPPGNWWPLVAGSAEPSAAARHVLTHGAELGFGLSVAPGSDTARGAVRGAVVGTGDERLLHIARLVVLPEHRRRGLARALLSALADWAQAKGAARCVLQVADDNHNALELYRSLGCVPAHRYRYWSPPL